MCYAKCRKSAYFARKLLRLVSGRFSASSGNINMHKRYYGNEYLYVILWNIRFHHFTSHKGDDTDSADRFREYGASPVCMQNLASPVESIAIHAHNKTFTILDLPTRETQDFASLLLAGSGMRLRFFPCMYAKFCVSCWLHGNIRTVISLFHHFVLSLYKISFGSAISSLVKLRFPNLLLHSPCIIFV